MKKIIIPFLFVAAVLAVSGCAKQAVSGPNDANKRYFDAWVKVNHPEARQTELGVYIIEDEPGTGAEVKEGGFVLMDYIATNLEGNIASSTYKETAEQLGNYSETAYYGPKFQTTTKGTIHAGLLDAMEGMKVGGHRKVVIPTWLMTYSTHKTEKEFLAEESSTSSAIYDITVKDFTENIIDWQIEKIGSYLEENSDLFNGMTTADSLKNHKGFYYKSIVPAADTTSFPSDTTIYINYTGRLIDGTVFDTTDERVAKDNGLWSASRTYAPVSVTWGEDSSDINMGGSSIITGFSLTLWQMRAFERGIGIFTSAYGYGYSGSGESIPGFAPLIFEIKIVKKPED